MFCKSLLDCVCIESIKESIRTYILHHSNQTKNEKSTGGAVLPSSVLLTSSIPFTVSILSPGTNITGRIPPLFFWFGGGEETAMLSRVPSFVWE